MIEKNLGNMERVIRALIGIGLIAWALFLQPALSLAEWFALVVAVVLLLSGIFSRCYLWYVLDINTRGRDGEACDPRL